MKPLKSLRTKFVRTMLLVTGIIGVATLAIVVFMSAQASSRHLASVERYIQEGITSKGKVLTENHALALRSLTLDNAFVDMQGLVGRAVQEDPDLFYGLYVNAQGQTLAYAQRGLPVAENPDQSAALELGLSSQELLVKKLVVTRTTRRGVPLLEVAAPVLDENGEVLGTIRYALSTARMSLELERAKADAQASLTRSLWFLGSLVGGAVLLGIVLSRTQGVRITRPLTDLTLAAQGIAAGNREVRVVIDSGDELELLGATFNSMVEDLDASYRRLEEMNRTLEQKVEQRTTELAQKNRDMRLVLDNVDQGFATLSPDGTMALERSRVVDSWFGACSEPLPFWEYIERVSPEFAAKFQLGWEQLVDGVLPLEASLAQLPVQLNLEEKIYSFRYLPFYRDERLEGVLVVIADITERVTKEREEAEQRELMQVFKKLMIDRAGFEIFLKEADHILSTVRDASPDEGGTLLKRALHTLKGNAAFMGLGVIAGLCHELEEQLAENGEMSPSTLERLCAHWQEVRRHVAELTGKASERTIDVPAKEYAALVERLTREGQVSEPVLRQILGWRLEPVVRPLRRLAEQARGLARRLNKGELDVVIEAADVRVDPDRFDAFFTDAVHVVRNAVDHGLEPAEERVAAGKSPNGRLVLRAHASEATLTLEIEDDGRGVDWQAIGERARARGLPAAAQEDLLRALCADGVTTRASADTVSGRGVGMAAFRQRVESMRGSLEVRSTRGVGTTWIVRFPVEAPEVTTRHRMARSVPVARSSDRNAVGRR